MIPEYAESIVARLAFDPALSRSVRAEVEDHLWEAVAADPEGRGAAAERRAIANFGDAQAFAAGIAAISLGRQARGIAFGVMSIVAAVFIAMKVRVAWYALMPPAAAGEWGALTGTVFAVDRYSFWTAIVVALAGWAWLAFSRNRGGFGPRYCRHLGRFFLLSSVAMAALVVSVGCDAVLTSLRTIGAGFSSSAILPIASMVLEIAGAAILVRHVRRGALRTALASRTLSP